MAKAANGPTRLLRQERDWRVEHETGGVGALESDITDDIAKGPDTTNRS
jgi:hypothetical protein